MVQDAEGRTFKFDGNDKQIEVTATSNSSQTIGKYFYDASGARVKKVVGIETTIFVYDAGGALAAEYSTATPTATPTTSYLTTDHLGSPRVITDKSGNVVSRRDFMPFGEEILRANSGNDSIRKRFTGYEKDLETNLDFAEARMYQNKHGRFTAVDPLMASASPGNPQSFNRYTYINNNPINDTDPSGLCPTGGCSNYNGNVYTNGRGVFSTTQQDGFTQYTGENTTAYDASSNTYYIVSSAGWDRVEGMPTQEQAALIANSTGAVNGVSAAEAIEMEQSQVGGTITNRAIEPVPCFSRSQLCNSPYRVPSVNPAPITLTVDEALDGLQLTLDTLGEVPGPGEIADGASGLISLGRQDYIGASLSGGAMLPFLGAPAGGIKIARTASKIADNSLVVRGGQNLVESFEKGSGVAMDSARKLDGVSANSANNLGVKELSSKFPHKQIGITTAGDIRKFGGDVIATPTKNNPFHCTICGITPEQGHILFGNTILKP